VNIGNRTSVKSGDVRNIGHRIAIWHRYRFGGRRHLAAQRVNCASLLPPGSGNNCSTLAHRVRARCHAVCRVRLISVRDIQRYLRSRRQRASDDGVSDEGYVRGTCADNAVKLGRDPASLSTLSFSS